MGGGCWVSLLKMASRAEVEAARRALARLSLDAQRRLRGVLAGVGTDDPVRLERALRAVFPSLAEYQSASAALGATMAESWARQLGVRPALEVSRPLDADRLAGFGGWAARQADAAAAVADVVDVLTKASYRRTVQHTAQRSGMAWARIPSGPTTCAFCLMLASRGAVYGSAAKAGDGHKYHGHCDCQVVLVRDERDLPEGFDLEGMRDLYALGVGAADSHSTAGVLAGIRKVTGSH